MKKDGTHFSGSVVRREASSITVTDQNGDTRIFLYSELSDIKYGAPDTDSPSAAVTPRQPNSTSAGNKTSAQQIVGTAKTGGSVPVASGATIQFAPGTEFPVRSFGYIDSCCSPAGFISNGVMDSDVRSADGKIAIPEGANVTMVVRDQKIEDDRVQMQFELGSADFDGHHYLLGSTKGSLEPGAVVTFQGAQLGKAEAKAHGLNVHIDDHEYMSFKAATPTVLKPSE